MICKFINLFDDQSIIICINKIEYSLILPRQFEIDDRVPKGKIRWKFQGKKRLRKFNEHVKCIEMSEHVNDAIRYMSGS